MKATEIRVHDSLTILSINGFEPADVPEGEMHPPGDRPGSANFLVETLGLVDDIQDEDTDGMILWTDYDSSPDEPHRFAVLVDTDDVPSVVKIVEECGYEVVSKVVVDEPVIYGDGGGIAAICKHPLGWIVLGGR